MRARAVAILLLILNIIGLGLGPPVVGKIADLLQPMLGPDALRYAMLTTIITGLMAAYCYWRATRTLREDLERGTSGQSTADARLGFVDDIRGRKSNVPALVGGGILAFCLLAFVNKFELLGNTCYYIGALSLQTFCVAPWVYFLIWVMAIVLLVMGLLPVLRDQLRSDRNDAS